MTTRADCASYMYRRQRERLFGWRRRVWYASIQRITLIYSVEDSSVLLVVDWNFFESQHESSVFPTEQSMRPWMQVRRFGRFFRASVKF